MKAHRFYTEIAFIPWNYRRSDPRTIRLFVENPDYFGLCVHGCNHTGTEFGEGSYEDLRELSAAALWRMDRHRSITGLPYDPVMVFPQSRFTAVALQALRDVGFHAAFSNTLRSRDANAASPPVDGQPAIAADHDLPLFLRRYPSDRASFREDMAAGRPLLIVEHHHAFRDGYAAMTEFVDWVNDLGNVRWTSLAEIARRYGSHCSGDSPLHPAPLRMPALTSARVAARRHLSEVRDNHVQTHERLSSVYARVHRILDP